MSRGNPDPPEATPTEPTRFVIARDSRGRWCVRLSFGWLVLELERGVESHDAILAALDAVSFIGWGHAPGPRCIRAYVAPPEVVASDEKSIENAQRIDGIVRPPEGLVAYLRRRARGEATEAIDAAA